MLHKPPPGGKLNVATRPVMSRIGLMANLPGMALSAHHLAINKENGKNGASSMDPARDADVPGRRVEYMPEKR
jgi:hypothetical protein